MMPDGNEISIPKGYTGTAFWGDTVEVDWVRRGRRHTPRVARIVERARQQYVVVIERVRDYAFGYPSDQRLHANFFIGAHNLGGAEDGQKVIIEMLSWDDPSDAPAARVVEVLGRPGDHEVEMHAILPSTDCRTSFRPRIGGCCGHPAGSADGGIGPSPRLPGCDDVDHRPG